MASSVSDRLCLLRLTSTPRRSPRFDPQRAPEVSIGIRRFGGWRLALRVRASTGVGRGAGWVGRSRDALERSVDQLREAVAAVPPVLVEIKSNIGSNLVVTLSIAFAILVVLVRKLIMAQHNRRQNGSVADLVKRGQLRSERRGISKPLKYEDPFNNPLMKMHNSDSTVEMFGKVYRMAPVSLTDEEQSSHKMRRSRVYKWKRPTMFLKEGDEMPPDVDPETVGWIPANHPFATTVSDIDENLAQNNVYQTDGVPFRIRAEHEELQKKLEALQKEQKLNVAVTPNSLRQVVSDESDERPVSSHFVDQNISQSSMHSCSEE